MRVLAGARAVAAAGWLAAATVGPAYGHAVLLDSRPGDGESVATPPTAVELEFNEPVVPVTVHLLDRQGHEVPDVTVQAQGNTVVVRPRAPLPPGGYFISYRVTSLDAHAVGATLRFGVGEPAPGASADVASASVGGYLGILARWLFYATALGAAGAALFVSFVGPPPLVERRVRRLAAGLAAVAIAAVVLRLGVAGLDLGGLPLTALLTSGPWTIASGTTLGVASALATVGLVILVLARNSAPAIAGGCPAGGRELRPDRARCFGVAALAHRACVGPARPLRRLLARCLRPAAVEPRRRARPIDPRAAPFFRSSHGGGRRAHPDRRHARLDPARRQSLRRNLHGLWLAVAAQARPCRPAARSGPGQSTGAHACRRDRHGSWCRRAPAHADRGHRPRARRPRRYGDLSAEPSAAVGGSGGRGRHGRRVGPGRTGHDHAASGPGRSQPSRGHGGGSGRPADRGALGRDRLVHAGGRVRAAASRGRTAAAGGGDRQHR